MVFRSGAAICGAVVAFAVSVAVARSDRNRRAVHSSAVVDEASGDAIVGAASTYNPFRPGWREGGPNTASGERYDPSAWAAAIKTSLREKFGGVQYGERPKYALVEAVGKKVIVKINEPIRYGVGVNGGNVIIGDIGYREHVVFTALGDPVNVAARLQDMTKDLGCEALIAEEVCRTAGLAPDTSSTRESPIRGRDRPMSVRVAEIIE